jgi:endonuclease III
MRKVKDPWAKLPAEFKEKVVSVKPEEIYAIIKDKALYRQKLKELRKEDQQLKEAVAAARDAGAVYRDGDKDCALSIAYCRAELKSRSIALPGD